MVQVEIELLPHFKGIPITNQFLILSFINISSPFFLTVGVSIGNSPKTQIIASTESIESKKKMIVKRKMKDGRDNIKEGNFTIRMERRF